MNFRYFQPCDVGSLAYAIYLDEKVVFRNPVHRAYFSPEDIPAIPQDDRRVYYYRDPVPHLAARNKFTLANITYTLFIFLPLNNSRVAYPPVTEEDTAVRPVRDLFHTLLSYTTSSQIVHTIVPVAALFRDCCSSIRHTITATMKVTEGPSLPETAITSLQREGLLLALGIVMPHLSHGGCIRAISEKTTEGNFTFTFLSGSTVENEFLCSFVKAVADPCGFTVNFLPEGICITLPAYRKPANALHAIHQEDDAYWISLGLLLCEWDL